MSAATLRTLHRWGGMLTSAFLLFYSASGLILNHRQAFSYFQTSHTEQRAVPQGSLAPINQFILATMRYRALDLCLLAAGGLLCLGGALLG